MKLLIKETFITIKKSFKRFISILLIVLLGVGFFAGIKATSPDMKKTINKYYKDTKFEDISLMSTFGITDEEINTLKEKYDNVTSYYSFDALIKTKDEEAAKVLSYNENDDINKLVLLEGRLPKDDSECVIERSQYTELHTIGDILTVETDNLIHKNLKIVGVVKSPIYISLERGSTTLLSGKIDYFIYAKESNFDMDYYTNAGIYLDKDMYSEEYDNLITKTKNDLEKVTDQFIIDRYNLEKDKALDKYEKSKNDYEKEKKKTLNKLNNAKSSLNKAKKNYQNGVNELNSGKKKAKDEYNKNIKELDANVAKINNAKEQIAVEKNNLDAQASSISDTLEIFQINPTFTLTDENNNVITKEMLEQNLELIKQGYKELETKENELAENLKTINDSYLILEKTYNDYQDKFKENETKLNKAKKTISNTEKTIASNESKANKEFKKAEEKLNDAKTDIDNMDKPEWYILDRESNLGYYQYNQDVTRIKNLGQLFPLVFFVVAILICLTSMTRMVEEERVELGTLKSLGFTSNQILFKYITYATLATIIGSIIGLLIGFNVLPNVIFRMYSMMYNVGDIIAEFNINYAILATLVSLLCTLFATFTVCVKSLREQPASLLRPKAVRSGKRILLERIKFIWKRLSFNKKVTMRNVFRYKKRMIMTIVGIAGCTGLIIAGFGLRDCVTGMVFNQYGKVNKYQLEITLKESKNNDDIYEKLKDIKEIKKMARVKSTVVELENYKTNQDLNLVIAYDDLTDFIALQDRKTGKSFDLKDGPIITEKITSLLKMKKESLIKLKDNEDLNFKVNNITENYMFHFIYMDKGLYKNDDYNKILVLTDKMTSKEEVKLSKEISKIDGISNLQFTSKMANVFDETMKNFEYVVLVLIVSANLLAFVVLYNLASVNISERIRELATIKVLGFYDKEVYDYIGRETTILTILSIVFGLGAGKLLTTFIIKTCELDMIMFNPKISLMSYIYGIILTVVFTIVVNITTYFALKKVEMIESLKSVE